MNEYLDLYADPGTNQAAAAVYREGRPVCISLPKATVHDVGLVLNNAHLLAGVEPMQVRLFLEAQHIAVHNVPGRGAVINVPSVRKLMLAADRWACMAELYGVPVTWVEASKWEEPVIKATPKTQHGKKLKKPQRYKMAIENLFERVGVVRMRDLEQAVETMRPPLISIVPPAKLTYDMCAAAGIGYAHRTYGSRWR